MTLDPDLFGEQGPIYAFHKALGAMRVQLGGTVLIIMERKEAFIRVTLRLA